MSGLSHLGKMVEGQPHVAPVTVFSALSLALDNGVLLSMSIEESGKVLASPRVQVMSDRAVQVAVGDIDIGIGLKPHIK